MSSSLSESQSKRSEGLVRTSAGVYTVVKAPATRKLCLLHGDFRLDNIVFDAKDPSRILAVLDWELASVGDPLADLTYFCIGHHLPPLGLLKKVSLLGREDNGRAGGSKGIPDGILSESQVKQTYIQHYTDLTLRDSSDSGVADSDGAWRFFLALGIFRAASIASGVHARFLQGNASGSAALLYGDAVPVLSKAAMHIVSEKKATSTSDLIKDLGSHSDNTGPMSREPSARCVRLLKVLRRFNDTVAIPAEKELIEHYMHADGKWPER